MASKIGGKWIGRVAGAVSFFASTGIAFAQGCAMCYTTAAAAKQAAIQALRSGILILLIPPVLITMGIFALALHRQDQFIDDDSQDLEIDRELNVWLSRMSCGNTDVSSAEDQRAVMAEIPKADLPK
jgi:hypothetical protein